MENTDAKLCPFKKLRYNLYSKGTDNLEEPSNASNLRNAKVIREEFGKCDKEKCMAYNADVETCKRM